MRTLKTIVKHLLLIVLSLAGVALFIMIVGEQSPEWDISTGLFFTIKFAAILAAYILYLIGRFLYISKLLPDYFIEKIEKELESEEEEA